MIIDFKIDDIVSIDSDSDIDTIKDSNLLEIYDNNKNILDSSESSDSLGMNSENILKDIDFKNITPLSSDIKTIDKTTSTEEKTPSISNKSLEREMEI